MNNNVIERIDLHNNNNYNVAMIVRAGIWFLITASAASAQQTTVVPTAGMVITRSTTLRPGTYALRADSSLDRPLIVIRGSDITLDLTNVRLVGLNVEDDPDRAQGVAVFVDGGSNVTIRRGDIRGYKIAIRARGTRNLRLIETDLSYNWKPRLYSIVEHESIADWLSFHQNDKGEWLRFGAAIYLEDVRGGELRGNTVVQGMNGLLMTRSDSLLIVNNDFSYNSGLGIGMYRSAHNRILHNTIDFNVRGYSEGFYRRGQDSAGILMYEQSDSNVVAYNSVTHSGDGLFLWAGQSTMDTGKGGANDNVFYANDFSWAPTNGIEATFSRNVFLFNRAVGNEYGLWGGYSWGSLILGNHFEKNRFGVAIEHGQDNKIIANRFVGDSTAIQLWANRIEPSDWGYPKHRDTRSRDYEISWNTIAKARVGLRVSQTQNLMTRDNVVLADSLVVTRDSTPIVIDTTFASIDPDIGHLWARYRVEPIEGMPMPRIGPAVGSRAGIIIDEWGPYDWMSHKLWPVDSSLSTPLRLRVLAQGEGVWELRQLRGATVSRTRGNGGDTIVVTPHPGQVEDWTITLAGIGWRTRSPRGTERSPSEPYLFSYSRFDPRAIWDVKVYAFTDSTHPLRTPDAFQALLRGERGAPSLARSERRLDYVWYRPRIPGWPQDNYGLVATTTVDLPPGAYSLRTISDDGIRVFIDEQLVHADWSVHESRVREIPLAAGKRTIRVEYFQGGGWAELQALVTKK